MKIVHVLPGSGDRFYCENCVRDNALVRALRAAGQDVVVASLYLPQLSDGPIFYGGINAWLQQQFSFFRKTPRWLDRILDARPLLQLAAGRAGSVRAADLGEMTLSVLKGAEGNQAKELERLLRWLEKSDRPDAVHLSSPLLLGIGVAIKKRFGLPIVCSLQDEDTWIDAMDEPSRGLCWQAMADAAPQVDAFVAVSRSFADIMRTKMKIVPDRLRVVHVGVDPGDPAPPPSPPVVGFLARLSESMGLGVLAEAFLKLKRTEPFRNLRLHLSGGMTDDDKVFLEGLGRKFAEAGVEGDVKIYEDFTAVKRKEFFASLSVFSVPTLQGVAFGTYILESLAAGVPVVQPRLGSYPELVEATGGGVLYEPNDAETLARVLGELLADGARREDLGRNGRAAVVKDFSPERMAMNMIEIYRGVVKT